VTVALRGGLNESRHEAIADSGIKRHFHHQAIIISRVMNVIGSPDPLKLTLLTCELLTCFTPNTYQGKTGRQSAQGYPSMAQERACVPTPVPTMYDRYHPCGISQGIFSAYSFPFGSTYPVIFKPVGMCALVQYRVIHSAGY
jgi:hypothetical protein